MKTNTADVDETVQLPETDNLVHVHVETTAGAVGLDPPPETAHIRVLEDVGGWEVLLCSPSHSAERFTDWLAEMGAGERLERVPSAPTVHRFRLDTPSDPWAGLLLRLRIQHAEFRTDGSVDIKLLGDRKDMLTLLEVLRESGQPVNVQHVQPREGYRTSSLLTERQEAMLRQAFESGYYDVPRALQLKELAQDAGMSPGALSELLRRAEHRVVQSFLRHQGRAERAARELHMEAYESPEA